MTQDEDAVLLRLREAVYKDPDNHDLSLVVRRIHGHRSPLDALVNELVAAIKEKRDGRTR